jgi:hypothetical protein
LNEVAIFTFDANIFGEAHSKQKGLGIVYVMQNSKIPWEGGKGLWRGKRNHDKWRGGECGVEHKEFGRVFTIASDLQPLGPHEYGKPDRQRIIEQEGEEATLLREG